jgi:hypothetical protein
MVGADSPCRWLYINSRGSILLVVLYHLVYNMVVNVLNIPASTSLWAVYVGLNWMLAIFIVIRCGASRLRCARSKQEVLITAEDSAG